MFKLDQSPTYKWPVTVHIPADGGTFTTDTFDAHFKRLPQDRLETMRKQAMSGELTDRQFAVEVMGGWSSVTDGGVDVAFSQSTLDRLLAIPGTASALVIAFVESQSGAPRKN
jgi:hypothetical protein